MRNIDKIALLFSTAATAVVHAPAAAQQTESDVEQPEQEEAGGQQDSAGAPIVVTAQRRESTVQRTPLAITVASGDELASAQINDPTRISNVAPAVQLSTVGAQLALFVRGAGAPVANPRADPAAAYSVDGVAIARPISVNGAYFDLARIEILKGPQGTLYGRNSTVGAVNIITNRPSFDLEGSVSLELGNYDLVRTVGVINVPLSDTFAIRGAAQITNRDGYLSNGYLDAENFAGRLRALWEPSSSVSLLLNASYYEDSSNGPGDIPLTGPGGTLVNDDPWFVEVGPPNFSNQVPDDGFQDLSTWQFSAELEADLGFATLTVIPALIDTEFESLTYTGGFEQRLLYNDEQTSLEIRLASPADQVLSWIIGGLYLRNEQDGTQDLGTLPGVLQRNQFNELDLESYAVFGQLTFSASDALRLSAGLRYSNDTKTFDGFVQNLDINENPLPTPILPSFGDRNFEDVSFRVGLEYDVGPDNLLYANVATGYKAGGFNVGAPPNTFEPETITAYTIGSKNLFAGGRVRFNVEAWYWDYQDVQQVQFGFVNPPPNFALVSFNASQQESYGVEIDTSIRVGEGGTFNANLTYTNSTWSEFALPGFVFGPFNIPPLDLSGQDTPFAPRWSANLSYQHEFVVGNGGTIVPAARTRIRSAQTLNTTGVPGSRVSGTMSSDLSLTYRSPDESFELQAYVNNLEEELVFSFAGVTPAGLWGTPGAPRTYGVRAVKRF